MSQHDDNTHSTIKPAQISLSANSGQIPEQARRRAPKSVLTGIALAVLFAGAIGVIFFLPAWLQQDPEKTSASRPPPNSPGPATPVTSTARQASPWTEAQLARQRKETQEILSLMLEKQDELEDLNVSLWAAGDYEKALEYAENGDALYRQRDFIDAREQYQQGLDALTSLMDRSESVFQDNIDEGFTAINSGDSTVARDAFELALAIRPDSEQAMRGRQRAATLDQVLAMLDEGEVLLDEERFQDAQQLYEEILEIDPDTERAREQLAYTRQSIVDDNFTAEMSAGFSSLEKNQLEAASNSFTRALRIKPSSQEARNALQQTESKLTGRKIKSLLEQAEAAGAGEEWDKASGFYAEALKLEPNLAIAQSGKQHTDLRSRLDKSLAYAIANPLRLANQKVYDETNTLFRQALQLPVKGDRLRQQLAALKDVLEQSRQPIIVNFLSNKQTSITIYRVGDLGKFDEKLVALVPGDYVAVGKRPGYQDVRVEFKVSPENRASEIIVACDEKISF